VSGARKAPPDRKPWSAAGTDAVAIALIAILSALPYLPHLGFYSDDWGLLSDFSAEPSKSVAAIVGDSFAARPVQGLYLISLFGLFGLDPLGYHIVNTTVLAGAASLLYLLLLRLNLGRGLSLAATLLFLMLPQLSTVRVWYSAFQIPLGMALMLVSMHCQLSYARAGGPAWLIGAIVAALLSIGAYEIFAPLIAGFAAMVAIERWPRSGDRRKSLKIGAAIMVIAGLLALGLIYKLMTSERAGAIGDPARYLRGLNQFFRLDYDWRTDSSLNIVATPRAYFLDPLRGWWKGVKALATGQSGIEVSALAIAIAGLALWRLKGVRDPTSPSRLLLLGVAAFLLGNSTFLIVPAVAFTSTGIDNRVQVAAAIGVAMIFASMLTLAARAVPARQRAAAFAIAVAVVAAASFARLSAIEAYWAHAPQSQARVLAAARADLGGLPADSTVILDGICPYEGPAVVFETFWDVGGALTLALGRRTFGDTVSQRMSVGEKGLETSIYKAPRLYPYGPGLYVYNVMEHLVVPIPDRGTAIKYFGKHPPRHCPGFVARGVEV